MGKRKYYDDHSRSDARGMSIGQTYGEVKRARTSESGSPVDNMDRPVEEVRHGDGWQVVTSKRNRPKGRRDQARSSRHENGKPEVYFDPRRGTRQPVRLEDLRDLALYILADVTAPSWVAVKRRHDIRKVVVVMVSGLDDVMLEDLRRKLSTSSSNGKLHPRLDSEQVDVGRTTEEGNISEIGARQHCEKAESNIDWLLRDKFSVRGPGDSRQPKVHSPLQAMIMKGTDETANFKKGTPASERSFQPVRTPIVDFIHSADELQEAEYPIHPALFTSESGRDLELKRREAVNQSSQNGWVDSDVQSNQPNLPAVASQDFISQGLSIYAIDCEMVMTSDEKSSLARVSVVSWPDGRIILDEYVKPDLTIINYFTQYSGITEKILEKVTTRLADIQEKLKSLFTSSTILLGHSLESDMNALKMTHPFIIDTSMIYPHPRGLPLRSSLKFLANKYLKREIQKGGSNGHDSVEDARAVLDLVRLKCDKGPKWGTNEANGETIFKKISRTTRHDGMVKTHAIVEYGTPERGFGKDATIAIGCQDDSEIVKGILRCCNGDKAEDGKNEVAKGGVDFVWARLRALEFARGWSNQNNAGNTSTAANDSESNNNNNAAGNNKDKSSVNKTQTTATQQRGNTINPPPPSPQLQTAETDAVLQTTISHINKIRDSLPPNTLLILCSGTSDMRLVTHYQALQAQYRREFKVKKWDELSVRWTDVEEQALRQAVDDARMGWGWVGVV